MMPNLPHLSENKATACDIHLGVHHAVCQHSASVLLLDLLHLIRFSA